MSTPREWFELRVENVKLRVVIEYCWELAGTGYNIDGGGLQDELARLGLLVQVPADAAFREEWDADTMYVLAWSPLARQAAQDSI